MTFRRRSQAAEALPAVEFGHLRRALAMQLEAVRVLAGVNDAAARVAYGRARAIEAELTTDGREG